MSANGHSPPRRCKQDVRRALGQGIVRLRQRKGWSQALLAKRLGVTRHRLGKWELGLTAPSLVYLKALLETFEVTFAELIGRQDRAVPEPPLPPGQRREIVMYINRLVKLLRPMLERPKPGKRGEVSNETAFDAMEAPMSGRR